MLHDIGLRAVAGNLRATLTNKHAKADPYLYVGINYFDDHNKHYYYLFYYDFILLISLRRGNWTMMYLLLVPVQVLCTYSIRQSEEQLCSD
jgi:hypothetical protein